MHNKNVLGFDFGLKHIGIAVGQTNTKTAHALTSLKAKQGIPNWDEIKDLIKTWEIHLLIVGMPLNMDGTKQPLTYVTENFVTELQQHYQLPVELVDERLTSVEARSRLFAEGGFKALKKQNIDSLAAQLIIETWFSINH